MHVDIGNKNKGGESNCSGWHLAEIPAVRHQRHGTYGINLRYCSVHFGMLISYAEECLIALVVPWMLTDVLFSF